MSKYFLPYKHELEYVHVNGKIGFNLGKSLKSIDDSFKTTIKRDEPIPGMVCVMLKNLPNNKSESTFSNMNWSSYLSSSYLVVGPTITDAMYVAKTYYKTAWQSEINPATGDIYNNRVEPYSGKIYNMYGGNRYICYYTRVYLKAGETLCLSGSYDDGMYVSLDGVKLVFSTSYAGINYTYTATADGYHNLKIICMNYASDAGWGTDNKETGESADGLGMYFNGSTDKVFIGNQKIDSDRFFLPTDYTECDQLLFGDSKLENCNSATYSRGTGIVNLHYGDKSTVCSNALTDKTEIVYSDGEISVGEDFTFQADPESYVNADMTVGTCADADITEIGLIGNIYSAELSNCLVDVTDSHIFYPVVANDDTIKLYDLTDGSFIDPTYLSKNGKMIAGPTVHTHDYKFEVHSGEYVMPYDREVASIHSDGTAWFPEGYFPEFEKDKPYDFTAPSEQVYCVVDHLGNPCLYDILNNKFIYNLGIGRLHARETIHLHDDWFLTDNSQRIREIPGDTVLLTGTDVNYAYKMVDTLPDPNVADTKVVVPTKAMEGFSEGQVLIARKVKNVYKWQVASSPTEGVGVPTDIRSSKISNRVNIRWKDPDDTMDPTGTTVLRKWKYTRLVRKVGSYPKGPYDGIIVVQNSVKDYYNDYAVIDYLPPNINGVWYYKLYAYSDDDVVSTSSACQFTPFDLDWSKMSNYIQTGKATSIFGIGDEITISGETEFEGADSIWNDLTFVVAGFDLAKPVSSKLKHSITLVSKILPTNTVYDKAWGSYRLVTSGKAEKGITYYVKSGTSSYKKANPQPTAGTTITASMGYYIAITDSRRDYGTSRWSEAALRTWLNALQVYEYVASTDTTASATKEYFKKNSDGTYTQVNPSSYTNPNPSKLSWYEKSSTEKIDYVSTATPPLLAIKSMDETFYNCVIATTDTAAIPSACGAGASETTEVRVSIPSYSQITGSYNGSVLENKQITLFTNPDKWIRNNAAGIPTAWWTRSPEVDEGYSTIKYMSAAGEIKTGSDLISKRGVFLVITLG